MTVEQVSEEIVMFLEKNTDYLQRVKYVQTKIREIINEGNRNKESLRNNRPDEPGNTERNLKEDTN